MVLELVNVKTRIGVVPEKGCPQKCPSSRRNRRESSRLRNFQRRRSSRMKYPSYLQKLYNQRWMGAKSCFHSILPKVSFLFLDLLPFQLRYEVVGTRRLNPVLLMCALIQQRCNSGKLWHVSSGNLA